MTAPEPVHGRGADVRLPPPLVYAVPLLLLWLLDRAVPWRLPDVALRTGLGWALLLAGFALAGWGAATFRRQRTTVIPHHPVTTVVTTGPYRFTRNPMYLGMALAYLGASLLLGSSWPLLGLPLVVLTVDRLVIAREERYLHARFGAQYEDFCRRTHRWV